MNFIDFPLLVGENGRLAHAAGPEASIIKLLEVMARTPRQGWRGAEAFGLRETLAELRVKYEAHQAAVKQINAVLDDLGIDWVRVDEIKCEPVAGDQSVSYLLTLSYVGKGTEMQELRL